MSSQPPRRPSDSELMPPPPRPPARTRSTGRTASPITLADSDSDFGTDTAVPPSTPHARTRMSKHSSERMLDDLRSSLQGFQARANYCCGGSVLIQHERTAQASTSSREPISAPRVTLRFDKSDGSLSKVQFPLIDDSSSFEELLRASTPATVGNRGEDILDETYRKLDRSKFSVDFHPHDYGIIDTIAQVLLPGVNRPISDENVDSREDHWGVRAELSELNIHSAPSSRFQKPFETLQGTHFGSLIVCLPSPHQGGQILHSHTSHHSTIATSTPSQNPTSITWSAFYNNCTHELLPLSSGHKITLTYHLFISERIGGALQPFPAVDPTLYPLYQNMKAMLERQDFVPDGGTLGIFLTHPLPHTTRSFPTLIPYSLRGIDLALFSVLSSLNLHPTIRPILGEEAWDEYQEWIAEHEIGDEELISERENVTRILDRFGRIRMLDLKLKYSDDPTPVLRKYLPLEERRDVIWLNEARHEGWEVQVVHLKGNEEGEEEEGGSLMWHYSYPVIFVHVPSWSERGLGKGKGREGVGGRA